MRIYITLTFLLISSICHPQSSINFAVIGDYGNAGPDEEAVSKLVKSWNPEFIITTGDNNHDIGSATTIDANIGQYYHEFIYPYVGNYGNGATFNKFFPSLGNHDWGTPGAVPYLNYFVLPGNERYYDFVKGPVHFFVIDSDSNEVDGRDSNSVQAMWLKNALSQSSSRFNVVYFHHSPFCSGIYHGSEEMLRWPFKNWGASTVMSGHEHLYERLNINGFPYFVNGLGGTIRSFFAFPISGSQVRYRSNFGAMIVTANNDSMVLKFYNIAGTLIDNYKILPAQKILNLKLYIEGFYNPASNNITGDTVTISLRNSISPYQLIDSSRKKLSTSGNATFNFLQANNSTPYYIVAEHRNSIQTWSSNPITLNANTAVYDFTISASSAFGNNLKQIDSAPLSFAIYGGDINKDGSVDLSDLISVFNDAANFVSGYVITDVTGDNFVDVSDINVTFNNSISFVNIIRP